MSATNDLLGQASALPASAAAALGQLAASMRPVVQALTQLAASMQPVVQALTQLAERGKPLVAQLGALQDEIKPVTLIFAALQDAINPLADAVNKARVALGQIDAMPKRSEQSDRTAAAVPSSDIGLAAVGRAVSAIASTLGKLFSTLSRFAAGLQLANEAMRSFQQGLAHAHQLLLGKLEGLVGAVTPFVNALNPNLVFGLNYAMRSLYATIGTALEPVVKVLTGSIRQVAGMLLPAMKAIAPALGSAARALMNLFAPTIQFISESLQALAPTLEKLAGLGHTLVAAWGAIRAVLLTVAQSLAAWLKGLFGGGGKDFFASFRDAIHTAVEALMRFTAMLARSLGLSGFMGKVAEKLRHIAGADAKPNAGGAPPAPTDVAFRGFEDIQKTMTIAAFAAMGGGGEAGEAEAKSEKEWLKRLADTLDAMKEGTTIQEYIGGKIADAERAAEAKADEIFNKAKDRMEAYVSAKWMEFKNSLRGEARQMGNAVRRAAGSTGAVITGTSGIINALGQLLEDM